MHVSQKSQYTLWALFELAQRQGREPVTVAEVAGAQAIPRRFLELIFLDRRGRGMSESRRGHQGVYVLSAPPETITAGEILRATDGSLSPVKCVVGRSEEHCRLRNRCVVLSVWQKAQKAREEVYDNTTLQDLIDDERTAVQQRAPLLYAV